MADGQFIAKSNVKPGDKELDGTTVDESKYPKDTGLWFCSEGGRGAIMNDKQRKLTQLRQLLIGAATPTARTAQIKSVEAAVTNGCNLGNSIMSPRPGQIEQLCQFLSRQ